MSLSVNLLPGAYRRAQTRRRRIRLGAAIAAVLLSTELMIGLALHARAGKTRELADAAAAARAATAVIGQKMKAPTEESALLNQQLTLAMRLRTTHRWSRLLGAFAQAASPRVVLTSISTDPPRWTPGMGLDGQVTAKTGGASPQGLLAGLSARGYAADYDDLTRFIGNLQAAGAFASLELREAKRDKYMEQDAISFELQCRWR